jgi:hypothetical protein
MRRGIYSRVLLFLLGCAIVIISILLIQRAQTAAIFISVVLDMLSAALLVIAIISLIGRNMPGLVKPSRDSQQHQALGQPESSVIPLQSPLEEGEIANSQQ